jgi:hypothetical protein
MEILERNLEEMTAIEVLATLVDDFTASSETICFVGTQRTVTIGNLQKEYQNLDGVLAKHIGPLQFNGGPKCRLDCYTGNLLTVLMDYILIEWLYTGAYSDMVTREMVL